MKVRVVAPNELSPAALAAWTRLVQDDPRFGSPFLGPRFARAVGAATGRVRVLLMEQDGSPIAFLPFQRRVAALGWCEPAGGHLSDYHGLVYAEMPAGPPERWLGAAGIHLFVYDHLHPGQAGCGFAGPFDQPSPRVVLPASFETWWEQLRGRQRKLVRDTERCTRRIEGDLGPLRLQWHSNREEDLDRLVDFKRRQYARTGARDALAPAWTRRLLGQLHAPGEPACEGLLAVLRAGTRIVALHFGLRRGDLLHYWFPVYDPELQRYSPGRLLLVGLLREAEQQGVRVVDMGKGKDLTKAQFANDELCVAEGWVCRRTLRGLACKALHWGRSNLGRARARHSTP